MASRRPKRRTLRRAKRHLPIVHRPGQTGIYPGQKGRGCAVLTLALTLAIVSLALTL